jgi:hypothetical protein
MYNELKRNYCYGFALKLIRAGKWVAIWSSHIFTFFPYDFEYCTGLYIPFLQVKGKGKVVPVL